MSQWGRLYGSMWSNPKVVGLSNNALGAWTRALSYSIQSNTFGFIDARMALMLQLTDEIAAELTDAGLWFVVDGGWQFHDWNDYQTTEEEMDDITSKRAEAGRKSGEARRAKAQARKTKEAKPEQTANKVRTSVEQTRTKHEQNWNKNELDVDVDVDVDITPLNPPSGGNASGHDDAFEKAWKSFPADGRKAKPKARKAWNAAIRQTPPEQIQAAIERYAAEIARTGHKVKWMQGWLSDGRYLDETPLPVNAEPRRNSGNGSNLYQSLNALEGMRELEYGANPPGNPRELDSPGFSQPSGVIPRPAQFQAVRSVI